jgi:GNAT superfamily N-acetyltransferase
MIKLVTAGEVLPLRALVLREGRPLATAIFPKDDDPTTVHFAYLKDGEIVTVATVVKETHDHGQPHSYQLRGMATHPHFHGAGYGAKILSACLDHVRDQGGYELWCNARVSASGFYERQGFTRVLTESFDVPDVGPHYRMTKRNED